MCPPVAYEGLCPCRRLSLLFVFVSLSWVQPEGAGDYDGSYEPAPEAGPASDEQEQEQDEDEGAKSLAMAGRLADCAAEIGPVIDGLRSVVGEVTTHAPSPPSFPQTQA